MSATKAAYAAELTATMRRDRVSVSELARRMRTDRSTVRRVLDPADESVTVATLSRAAAALGREPAVVLVPERPSVLLEHHREELRAIAAAKGLTDVRVFGSAARGDDTPASDLDLVAELPATFSLLDQGAMIDEMTKVLGCRVDLLSLKSLKPHVRENVEKESVPL